MDTTQISALLAPFLESPLSGSQLDQVSLYIGLLLRWNQRINLTAIRQEEEIVTRHFGESFFLARHLFPSPYHPEKRGGFANANLSAESKLRRLRGVRAARRNPEPSRGSLDPHPTTALPPPHILDIGSGAGFPALPLKIWAPQIHLTLIESNHKKAAFLREVARSLTLSDIDVIADRAETAATRPGLSKADVVTLRAVEHFETVLPQAVIFLAPHGRLALLVGAAQLPALATLTNLNWEPPIDVPKSHSRKLSFGCFKQVEQHS